MPFPVSLSSLPAAVVLIPETAPFRAMRETLDRISLVHLDDLVGLVGFRVRTLSCWGLEVIRRLRCTGHGQKKFADLAEKRGQTLKKPERVICPLQSTLSVILACFKARGSIAGVSETPFGTVFNGISMVNDRVAVGTYV